MRQTTLRIVAALPAVCMLSSGAVLAEEKSALMRTGDLACNDLCRRWMSLGQPQEPVPAPREPPTTAIAASPSTEASGPPRPSAEATKQVRAASGPAAPPSVRSKVVRQIERQRPATIVSGALAPAPRHPMSIGMLPVEPAETPEAPTLAWRSGVETIGSLHRPPSPGLIQPAEPDASATLKAGPSDVRPIRIETVGWFGPADQGPGDMNPKDAGAHHRRAVGCHPAGYGASAADLPAATARQSRVEGDPEGEQSTGCKRSRPQAHTIRGCTLHLTVTARSGPAVSARPWRAYWLFTSEDCAWAVCCGR